MPRIRVTRACTAHAIAGTPGLKSPHKARQRVPANVFKDMLDNPLRVMDQNVAHQPASQLPRFRREAEHPVPIVIQPARSALS